MTALAQAVAVCSGISSIVAVVVLLVKPLRERVLGMRQINDGMRCILRSEMLSTYYNRKEDLTIRQHEKENFMLQYAAYKALGGNSFIDDICREVRKWEVVT